MVLLGNSLDETLKRNMDNPRWGNTEELQKLEAESFWNIERPRYKSEAEKYGYKFFENNDDAYSYAFQLLK